MVIQTNFVGLSPSGIGYRMSYGLKYWSGAKTETDPVDIDKNYSTWVKPPYENVTVAALVNRGLIDIGKQMQADIDDVKKINTALGMVDFPGDKNTALQGGLDG